jgi:hypothetical protein
MGRCLRGQGRREPRLATSYRGLLLIGAAKEDDPAGSAMVLWTMADPGAFGQPGAAFKARGAIIGMAYLADILTDSASRWAQPRRFHWTLEFPAPVDPPVPCSGMPGLWTPPPAAAEAVAHWL